MFIPGIKSVCTTFSEGDGYEYNYLCTFETKEGAIEFAKNWAIEKTPADIRKKGMVLPHTVKEAIE